MNTSANSLAASVASSSGVMNSGCSMALAHGGNSTADLRYKGAALSTRCGPLLPVTSQKPSVVP